MNTVIQVDCNCQFHQEISAFLTQIEQRIMTINSWVEPPMNWQNQRDRITAELTKVKELMAFYQAQCKTTNLEPSDQFIQGYQVGKQCNQVLYDASQVPVQEVRMALALDLSQNSVPPYLLGIQLGWRLAVIEQSLTRFLPDDKPTIA